MLLAFEVLLEAGLRLPKAVGRLFHSRALVVGEAAITANMLSPCRYRCSSLRNNRLCYPLPGPFQCRQDMQALSRFMLNCKGLYGVAVGIILIVYHLCSI
jgi:spore germination protein KA